MEGVHRQKYRLRDPSLDQIGIDHTLARRHGGEVTGVVQLKPKARVASFGVMWTQDQEAKRPSGRLASMILPAPA
jgi:hypothetical protein